MSRFSFCIPDFDETAWHEADYPNVCAVDDAAERYAEQRCAEDCDLYRSFEDEPGLVVLVKMDAQSVKVVRVTAERTWAFRGTCV